MSSLLGSEINSASRYDLNTSSEFVVVAINENGVAVGVASDCFRLVGASSLASRGRRRDSISVPSMWSHECQAKSGSNSSSIAASKSRIQLKGRVWQQNTCELCLSTRPVTSLSLGANMGKRSVEVGQTPARSRCQCRKSIILIQARLGKLCIACVTLKLDDNNAVLVAKT